MEFWEVLKKRHCARKFNPDRGVSDEQIERLLEAGRIAPSAGNLQDWFFVAVKDGKTRQRMQNTSIYDQGFIDQAPVIIVVCAEPEKSAEKYDERGRRLYTLQDSAIAAFSIWLAAVDEGLGACWVGAFDEVRLAEVLELKEGLIPVVMLPIGYSVAPGELPKREELADISKVVR